MNRILSFIVPSFVLLAFIGPLHSQTVLEWALTDTSPAPDVDVTPALNGSLEVAIIGDGLTSSVTNASALTGRFAPVTLANPDDSLTVSYDILIMGGLSRGAASADLRWGLFNSNGTTFGGAEASLSGWTGPLAWNSGSPATDGDLRVRNLGSSSRFYVSGDTTDLSGPADFANQNFNGDGVIFTVTVTATRLAGGEMEISTSLVGDDGYSFALTARETANAEFTFDRVGFWVNALDAELVAFKSATTAASTDGDGIPDLEEARWFGDLTTANDTSDFDGDGLTDAVEISNMTSPIDSADPPFVLEKLFVDFNADGTAGQTGPAVEAGFLAYTAAHQSNEIDDAAGIDFFVFGNSVNLAVEYSDDNGSQNFDPSVKQMIGRSNSLAESYQGNLSGLMRDWIGIDSRVSAGGRGPEGNPFGSSTNLSFTLSGLPPGAYQYRAYHHDVGSIQGLFELNVTDANRDGVSLGEFQMTAGRPVGGNPVFDATGNKGVQGSPASLFNFAPGAAPPEGGESRVLLAANIGQTVVSDGTLAVFLDDFPASITGSSADRTWLAGIGYKVATGNEITYVDTTLLNTAPAEGGPDSNWADGDDGSTGGTVFDGQALNDGLWRFRSGFGNGGIWEATGSSSEAEDCLEIVTSATVANATYDVYVFYYPVEIGGDYPVRAGFAEGVRPEGADPGENNPPSLLSSTVTVPFQSDGSPVVFTYRVFEEAGDESLSVVGINGFEITERGGAPEVVSIAKENSTVSLTWNSFPGEEYTIRAGLDLVQFPFVVADGVPSQTGSTTSLEVSLPVELQGEPRVFFIVEQEP